MGYIETAGGGVLLLGTKEHVCLFNKLPSGLGATLQHKDVGPGLAGGHSRLKAGRPRADYKQVCRYYTNTPLSFWVSTTMPSRHFSRHVRTPGTPSTIIIQEEQLPMAQNSPLARCSVILWDSFLTPAAWRAAATVSLS